MKLRWERRLDVPKWLLVVAPAAAVLGALLLGAMLMLATGTDPVKVYGVMLKYSFGSKNDLAETGVKMIPLLLCSLGVGMAMRMQLWNVGAEGQFYAGAIAAAWLPLFHPDLPAGIMLPGMFALGLLGGGIWALLAAIPRAYWGIDEVITTLMFNYIAVLGVAYLATGPWQDQNGNRSFPASPLFVETAHLPTFGDTRMHLGLIFGLVAAVILALVLSRTSWGYQIRVIGESPKAAKYAGMQVARNILLVMFLSGGLAGLAGMTEVSGIVHRIQPEFSAGYGFSAIIVAALARGNPLATVLVSFLFGALIVGGFALQTVNMSSKVVLMLQGAILFAVLASDFFVHYRVHFARRPRAIQPVNQSADRKALS